ncbi:MAG TPA: nucleotide disphospho-sugar-binding domain-containing protein [Kofleriaceae bacterium]
MTRYLLATWEGGGVLPPELGLARRLIARGHSVHVIADPAAQDAARSVGCTFSPWVTAPHKYSLDPDEDLLRDWEIKNPLASFKKALDVFVCGPADRFAADTLSALQQHPADVILADFMILGAQIAAEAAKLPLGVLMPNINMRPGKGVPPVGPGLMPARGPLGAMRDTLIRAVGNRVWAKGVPGLNRARVSVGLTPLPDIWQQFDRATRVFVMTSPSFDFQPREQQPNLRYVGPILDDPTWAGAMWTPPWPASNTDPLVLVGLSSTYQQQQSALQNVIDALAPLPVRALVTLGPSLPADAVTSPGPHIAIVQTAPHGLVFPHAAAAITHCGHGTTIRALAAGVPLVCMPMGRDQNDTAARVVASGAGVRIKPTAAAAAIRSAVERVLREPSHTTAARGLRDAIARETAEVDPVALLEELAPQAAPGVSHAS